MCQKRRSFFCASRWRHSQSSALTARRVRPEASEWLKGLPGSVCLGVIMHLAQAFYPKKERGDCSSAGEWRGGERERARKGEREGEKESERGGERERETEEEQISERAECSALRARSAKGLVA